MWRNGIDWRTFEKGMVTEKKDNGLEETIEGKISNIAYQLDEWRRW
jgi:hypothetical protein